MKKKYTDIWISKFKEEIINKEYFKEEISIKEN